jgi:YgiT-type zinc finger domain-containing protein
LHFGAYAKREEWHQMSGTMDACRICGARMRAIVTDLPFKVSQKTIVILKELPVLQCERCNEYLLEDPVMERVEAMINKVDEAAELEILKYAA